MIEGDGIRCELSEEDRRVLDALVAAEFDPASLAEADRRRAERIVSLLELLDEYPVAGADDDSLIDATLARVQRAEDDRAERLQYAARWDSGRQVGGRGLGARLPDLITVAAMLLIGAGVIWPLASQLRERSIDASCANRLRTVGGAFALYAGEHDGALPTARAGLGPSWDSVSNVLNLQPLVEGGYCERHHFNCPGALDHQDGNYSYQWQVEGQRPSWSGPFTFVAVLGDRNPLIDAYRRGVSLNGLAISANHAGRGQNILVCDGSTRWLPIPLLPFGSGPPRTGRGDNIWLPDGCLELVPGACPVEAWDTFLAH